jgi:hypothetical protein
MTERQTVLALMVSDLRFVWGSGMAVPANERLEADLCGFTVLAGCAVSVIIEIPENIYPSETLSEGSSEYLLSMGCLQAVFICDVCPTLRAPDFAHAYDHATTLGASFTIKFSLPSVTKDPDRTRSLNGPMLTRSIISSDNNASDQEDRTAEATRAPVLQLQRNRYRTMTATRHNVHPRSGTNPRL